MSDRAELQLTGDLSGAADRARLLSDHGAQAGLEEGDRWMRPSRFTETEIQQALREVRGGTTAVDVCRRLRVTQTTFYRWRKKYDGAATSEAHEIKELRSENQKLKMIVANLMLGKST
jgi:putative transposase